ncbi:hypothetical protein DICVIV_09478, partial [Dictyocaulus viviparus]
MHITAAGLMPYYGVPLGSIEHTELGIRGNVFVSDDHTIVLDKFTHIPPKTGCTTMMIGPPRADDAKRVIGEGILLPYTQPNFSWEDIRRQRRRAKRRSDSLENDAIEERKVVFISLSFLTKSIGLMEPGVIGTTPPPGRLLTRSRLLSSPDESYEEIEYVEDVEETQANGGNINGVLPTLQDGEARRQQISTTPSSIISFPTLLTESSRLPVASTESLIVFNEQAETPLENTEDRLSVRTLSAHSSSDDIPSKNLQEVAVDLWDSSFLLPPANDEQVAFLLTNGARISDYTWMGLYDQCENKSVKLVSLIDVDPPREEEIGHLKGIDRNISSGAVRILNCNTILISEFHYQPVMKFPNTYFYVGVGNVTHTSQLRKARTIGYEYDDTLDEHKGDTVMIRLPPGIRTFDVDFLSIYNENEKKVYGYISLPSLLVPPCVDD